jgi:hypothetical protein
VNANQEGDVLTTQPNPNRTTTQAKDGQIIVGIKQDLMSMATLPLGGATYTPSSLIAFIQSRIDANNQVQTAKAAWQDAAKTYTAINAQATVVVRELRNLVIGAFGPTSPKLADFGFSAPKRTPLTPAKKVAAAAKRAATRKARGTLGKKQKLAITGTVEPTTTATPVTTTAPAAPAAPVAPAAPSPSPAPQPTPAPAPTPPVVAPSATAPEPPTAPAATPTPAAAPAPKA